MSISLEEAKLIINYNANTGEFSQTRHPFKVVGYKNFEGYINILLLGKMYKAHRLAFLFETGSFPSQDVDHINGIRTDNRINNLRLASRSNNQCNKKMAPSNSSGYKGVSWSNTANKWCARIKKDRKTKTLGYFTNKLDAYFEYCLAAIELHGEFANFG